MRLDRFLGEEESLADLTIDQAVRDELEDLDLARCRVLPELPRDLRREWDDGPVSAGAPTRRSRLETTAVVAITVQDLLTLSGVHDSRIGL